MCMCAVGVALTLKGGCQSAQVCGTVAGSFRCVTYIVSCSVIHTEPITWAPHSGYSSQSGLSVEGNQEPTSACLCVRSCSIGTQWLVSFYSKCFTWSKFIYLMSYILCILYIDSGLMQVYICIYIYIYTYKRLFSINAKWGFNHMVAPSCKCAIIWKYIFTFVVVIYIYMNIYII